MASMTASEQEVFLAEPRVGVISIDAPDRAPLAVPVWYSYTPGGEVGVWMDGTSYKVRRLRVTARFSLCVQHTERPYRYVSVEGGVTGITPIAFEHDLVPLVNRYLEPAVAARYLEELGGAAGIAGDVFVRMMPVRWRGEVLG